MASCRVLRRMFCAAAPLPVGRWERLKNSKAGETQRASGRCFCRSLVSDYKEACREMVVGVWERPLKASAYGVLLGGALTCFYTKPDQSSFEAALLDRSNQLGLLSPWNRNATSDGHVQSLVKLRNEGRLRHVGLGLLSLVYRADYDPDAALYEAQCSNVAAAWRELPQRILDVGLVSSWWVLDFKMKDYDVNDEEFKHLPEHMQLTAPPGVQEVERSERLHKESWLPPTAAEEETETNMVDRREEGVGVESQTEEV